MSGGISEHEVLAFIDRYNLEEPKNPDAKPDELILADNSVTLTAKKHFGNLVAVIAEGRWGAGKTYSALKIYHDLKSFAKVTYVPVRYATNIEPKTRIRGEASLIATLIAMAFVRPEDLKSSVEGALTNAKNVDKISVSGEQSSEQSISIEGELSKILEQYYLYLKQSDSWHAVILDELEIGIKTEQDAEAIVETIRVLRRLYDVYGSNRLMLIVFTAPIPPGLETYRIIGSSLKGYISTRITEPERRYLLGKVEFSSLDNREVMESVMKGIVEKSLELLEKKKNYKIGIENIDDAISLLIGTSGWLRFGVDILKHALAKAVVTSVNNNGASVDLKSSVEAEMREILGLPARTTVVDVFVGGKFGAVERDFKHIESLLKSILAEAKEQYSITGYYKAAVKREPGFESVTFVVKVAKREDRRVMEKEIPLVFWLRFTDLNEKALGKANQMWEGANIIILTLEECKHKVLAKAQKTFNVATIVYLPPEVMYFIIAGSKIRDLRIAETLRTLFTETYKYSILEAIRGLV